MGKRFKQFLLENEIRYKQFLLENEIRYNDNNDSTIRNALDKLPKNDSTRMIIAKFVLYCVEDVFEFNNDETRNAAINCINLIKQYINDPQSANRQELNNVAVTVNNIAWTLFASDDAITLAASKAAYTAADAVSSLISIHAVHAAAYTASNAASSYVFYTNDENDDYNAERIREEKLNEYKQYLNMLTARYHHSDENTFNKINQLTQNKPQTEQQWFGFLTNIIDELEVKNIIRQLPDGSSELHLPFANISANSQLELIDIISRNERIRDLIYSWFV